MKTFLIDLHDGDVITATSEIMPDLIEHQGIVCYNSQMEAMIYHTIPGEDLEYDTIEDFFKNRKLKSLERNDLNRFQIQKRIKDLGEIKYNLLSLNCYQFVNLVKDIL